MSKVVVYSKPNCRQCGFTKRVLDENGIDYEVRDVIESEVYLKEVQELGFSALPVVVAEGVEPFSGFKPDILNGLK